ncbi:hypothetical protein N8I77_013257 [Diaporthe amygdali]|uniref:Uncharacterized protein n=1 Tax=Phomopsis amygdali TaxID=1214568 RepID=A0AAD9VYQ8_PHOAM|nr:hypothetical protein N8I77_013257 [Diaporthe amygdali]
MSRSVFIRLWSVNSPAAYSSSSRSLVTQTACSAKLARLPANEPWLISSIWLGAACSLIWGAGLALVLALATPGLEEFLPKHDYIIDSPLLVAKVETALLQTATEHAVLAQCLALLRNVAANLLGDNIGTNPI